jgi:hypothetical protein
MPEHHQLLRKQADKPRAKIGDSASNQVGTHQNNAPITNGAMPLAQARFDPPAMTHHDILQLQRTIGNRRLNQMLQRDDAAPTAAPAPTLTPEQTERRNTAQALLDTIRSRMGVNVAVYLVNWNDDPTKYENDDEFKTQADQYAKDHLSFGVKDGKLKQGVAMGMDKSVAERLTQVVEKANALLDEFPDLYSSKPTVSVETLSVFTHGEADILQAGSKGKKDGKDRTNWIGPATFVKGLAENMSFISTVNLYACNTAGAVKVGDNFATAVQKQLEADLAAKHGGIAIVDVWGHTTAAHTTYNSNLVGMMPDSEGNNMQGDLKAELSKRLLAMVMGESPVELNEKDQKKLAGKASDIISKTLLPVDVTYTKGKDNKPVRHENWRTRPTDPLNTYFREITAFGIDRVWQDLTAASDPTDYSFMKLSADAEARMAKGIKEFRERFKPQLTAFQAEAAKVIAANTKAEPTPTP